MLWEMSFKTFVCFHFHVNALAPIYAFTVKLGMFLFSLNVIIPVCEYYADLTKCFGAYIILFYFLVLPER